MGNTYIFSNIVRFVDELSIFSKDQFENACNDIHSNELDGTQKENKDPCKPLFLDFPMEVDDRKFTKSYLIKEIPSPFILIACPIWTSVYHLKYFMLRSVQKFYILIGQK